MKTKIKGIRDIFIVESRCRNCGLLVGYRPCNPSVIFKYRIEGLEINDADLKNIPLALCTKCENELKQQAAA